MQFQATLSEKEKVSRREVTRSGLADMTDTHCPICEERDDDKILYKERLPSNWLNPALYYSAREVRPGKHNTRFQIVKCRRCGLIRSNPIAPLDKISEAYRQSYVGYQDEMDNLKNTYGHYLMELSRFQPNKGRLLEIGCGSGFFLDGALDLGYRDVWGVEPSIEAKTHASAKVHNKIISDFFRPGLFEDNSFDVICFFHVLDHLIDPNSFLNACNKILKPNGLILAIQHDVDAWSAKLLGKRSPIFDVIHIHLFNQETLRRIFEKNGFATQETGGIRNIFSIRHCIKLSPLSGQTKKFVLRLLEATGIANLNLRLKAGNLRIVARKLG